MVGSGGGKVPPQAVLSSVKNHLEFKNQLFEKIKKTCSFDNMTLIQNESE